MSKLYKDEFLEEVKILYPDHKDLHATIARDEASEIDFIEQQICSALQREGLDVYYLKNYVNSDVFNKQTLMEMLDFQIRKEELLYKFRNGDYIVEREVNNA